MRWAFACLILAACSPGAAEQSQGTSELEAAAIASGAIPDPATAPVEGLYEHAGESATDRMCLIDEGGSYRLGLNVNLGDHVACRAAGRAQRNGEKLSVTLEGEGDCSFAAAFDGEQISIPGTVPAGCQSYCAGEASLAGVTLGKSSGARADAVAAMGDRGQPLCG